MTAERTQAYGRVIKALEDLGPSKLQPEEQALIRDAADALIFSPGPALDPAARSMLDAARSRLGELVASGRWTAPTADRLLVDLAGCGPEAPLALQAA